MSQLRGSGEPADPVGISAWTSLLQAIRSTTRKLSMQSTTVIRYVGRSRLSFVL